MSKTSEKKFTVVVVIIAALIVVGLAAHWFFVSLKQYDEYKADLDRFTKKIANKDKYKKELDTLNSAIADARTSVGQAAKILPNKSQATKNRFRNSINDMLKKAKLAIMNIEQDKESMTIARFTRFKYKISLLGSMKHFMIFMNLLENNTWFMKIDRFKISPAEGLEFPENKKPDRNMNIELWVSTYTYEDVEG